MNISRRLRLLVVCLLLGAVFLSGGWYLTQSLDVQEATPAPADPFEQRIREYLIEHPEVIVEALQRYQEQQQANVTNQDQTAIAEHADALFRNAETPVGGNPNGDVTLVEFFDYNCPYCRRVAPSVLEAEKKDPQLRIVYKEFPILGPNSEYAAQAALAAHRQGQDKYVALHNALMASTGVIDEDGVMKAASTVGLDVDRLKADMDDPAIAASIARNLALAEALRITGTPAFVIGEYMFRGATDTATLEGFIKRARAKNAQ